MVYFLFFSKGDWCKKIFYVFGFLTGDIEFYIDYFIWDREKDGGCFVGMCLGVNKGILE